MKCRWDRTLFYRTPEGIVRVEVLYETETFWPNQKQLAEFFCVDLSNISYHRKKAYDSDELTQGRTLRKTGEFNRRVLHRHCSALPPIIPRIPPAISSADPHR